MDKKRKEATFKDNKYNGINNLWYENGQKNFEGVWMDDELVGTGTKWYENGQKQYSEIYNNGEVIWQNVGIKKVMLKIAII
jgi:antitoxin component YwqK of YwqJK toxin-antitoxin module